MRKSNIRNSRNLKITVIFLITSSTYKQNWSLQHFNRITTNGIFFSAKKMSPSYNVH